MISKKNFVITIGNYGSVVALHERNEIKNKIFIDNFNDAAKEELTSLFKKNRTTPIYILLDTVDQSYKKKAYPPIRKADLLRMVKRDMMADGDKESFKNYILLPVKKSLNSRLKNKPECLFISTSTSVDINTWLAFLLETPNRLVGVYMLPIETFNLFKLLRGKAKISEKGNNQINNLYCIILQNKVSGTRQIAFSDHGVVFTRILNYNFEDGGFLEKYEQDIYSTFEYLKRIFPNITISELNIINIFSEEVLAKIKNLQNIELKFTNYTPSEVASRIGYKNIIPENSNFCDMLISKAFSKEKKVLRFITPKIKLMEKFFNILRFSFYLNLGIAFLICGVIAFTTITTSKYSEAINLLERNKTSAAQEFSKIKNFGLNNDPATENGNIVDIERMIDLGKIKEALGDVGTNFVDFYTNLQFLKEFSVKLNSFVYSLEGFNSVAPTPNSNYIINFTGEIENKSGSIETLFEEFDAMTSEIKRNLIGTKISYTELPKNIDFNKQYLTFPIDFTVSKNSISKDVPQKNSKGSSSRHKK